MRKKLFIPEICRNTNLLLVLIITEIAVIIAWMANTQNSGWQSFGLWSMYAMWAVLPCMIILCLFRNWLVKQQYWLSVAILLVICFSVLFVLEFAIATLFGYQFSEINWSRLIRVWIIALLVIAVLLRLVALAEKLEQRNKAETESRIFALQSRIQPHFLFNSLNTISELVATAPEQAEEAIQALAMLFRVSLEQEGNTHSLEKEIRLCRRYIDLEQWRANGKLNIQWDVTVAKPESCQVPKLLLQPLLENAIKYGSGEKRNSDRKAIRISIKETSNSISIKLDNPINLKEEVQHGHGIALDNIKERLFVLYDDQQSFKVRSDKQRYQVIIKLPKRL